MASLNDLQKELREFPCHFIWNLEHKSIKKFQSLMDFINVHIDESSAMVIEGILFKAYLFFSDFKGNVEKKKTESIECISEVRRLLIQDPRQESLKNGYLSIALTLEAWLDRRDKTKLEAKIRKLRELRSKYEVDSRDYSMFQGSVHATKGFTFSRVGMIRYSESVEEFRRAVGMCPEETDWKFSLGFIIWRKANASVKRNEFDDTMMHEAESLFYEVLKTNHDHSLAMALLAEIKRRKRNYSKAEYFLNSALRPKPTQAKILGEVAKVYRKMKKYPEALNILHTAAERMKKPRSFIYHQLYLVYRDMSTRPPVDYLQLAIDANPSNLAAIFDRAKELISRNKYEEAHGYFEHILDNNESDPEVVISINYQFAMFLDKQKKVDDAIDKYQTLLDKALDECKEDGDPPFVYFKEIDLEVRQSIRKLKEYFKQRLEADRKDRKSRLQLADLNKKLGNTREACFHYQQLIEMQPPIDSELRWTLLEEVATMKTRNNFLLDVDAIIEDMEQLNLTHPKPDIKDKCKASLAVKKGKEALHDGRVIDAVSLFLEAVKLGDLEGARLLLDEVHKDRGNRDFYTYCAHIDVCIERSQGDDKQQLKEDLNKILSADTSDVGVVLGDLRNTQFNMERSIILEDNTQLVALRVDVIHKCRTILNQTMSKFRERHYGHVETCCDYFNIPKCSQQNLVKQVRNKLQKKYGWVQVELRFRDFFKFIVSIQPASNPQENNWMFALLRMDNANKHERSLGDKLKVEVYSDQLGNMAEQEFDTLQVARKACDKIQNILEEFYKYL